MAPIWPEEQPAGAGQELKLGPTCLKEKQLLTLTPFHWSLLLSGFWVITSTSNSILARTKAIHPHRPSLNLKLCDRLCTLFVRMFSD